MGKIIYMKVTKDEYELPIAVADSVKELSQITGNKSGTIKSSISQAKKNGGKSQYVKVNVEEEE